MPVQLKVQLVNVAEDGSESTEVSSTAHVADTFLAAGLITEDEKDATVEAAGQSKCGARGR